MSDLKIEDIVVRFLKKKQVKSVEIIKDDHGEPYLLKVKEVHNYDKRARLYEHLQKFGFQDFIIKTQHGQVIYGERVTKYRLDKPLPL
jgi:hypothetical protein